MKYPETLSRGKGGDVSRLKAAGISADEANLYHAAGLSTADGMIKLRTAGIGGSEANAYHAAGVTTLAEAQQWKAAGINGYAARAYHAAGVTTLDEATTWEEAGINGTEAADYHRAGVRTLAEAQRWEAAGINGYAADWYRAAGVTTLDNMLFLARMGRTPSGCADIGLARDQSGDAVVNRLLAIGDGLNRFPAGTLAALTRPSRLAEDLLAASDYDLRVAVVLAEDRYASTGEVSVQFIRQSIGIL